MKKLDRNKEAKPFIILSTPIEHPLPLGEGRISMRGTSVRNSGEGIKTAFTLAEVLITLGIIGIVAAMTLPSLIQNYKDKQSISQLKKTYSILQQAFLAAEQENGPIESWDLGGFFNPAGAQNLMNIISPHLKIVKNCSNTDKGCLPSMYYYPDKKSYTNLGTDNRTAKAVLADGTLIMTRSRAKNCNDTAVSNPSGNPKYDKYCAWVLVDINGLKKPNTLGRDLFAFNLFSSGIYPAGIPEDGALPFETLCKNININGGSLGFGCTGWALINENFDYLHCNDLNWDTKTKCK